MLITTLAVLYYSSFLLACALGGAAAGYVACKLLRLPWTGWVGMWDGLLLCVLIAITAPIYQLLANHTELSPRPQYAVIFAALGVIVRHLIRFKGRPRL